MPRASSYSGITPQPIVWYMKLSMSSAPSCASFPVDWFSPALSLFVVVPVLVVLGGGGCRFASATTLCPLRMQ
ncbi:hypothetical protein BJX62DRAFT_206817 [Aspergillus germanicus]